MIALDSTIIAEIEELLQSAAKEGAIQLDEIAEFKESLAATGSSEIPLPAILREEVAELDEQSERGSTDAREQLRDLNIPGKLKLALFGNGVCRALLIRDSNRMVQMMVLKNPKLTLKEVEDFARNSNLSEQVLRTISGTQAWTKSGHLKFNLVANPKTPPDVSLKWLRYLQINELRSLSKSKQVSNVVSTQARKMLAEKSKQ